MSVQSTIGGDTWVYHPDEEPRLVTWEEQSKLLRKGWYDTPAKFPVEMVESVGDFEESLADMDRKALLEFAENNGLEIDKRLSKEKIINKILEAI